jgi:transcription-repair coupling factor (superfamily II helicase)
VLTERQLFLERAFTAPPQRAGREPEAIIRDLGELSLGAPIVHEDHGIGRYRGLLSMDIGGMPGEFLDIEYAQGDRLYVPVAQLDRISRSSGANPDTALLHNPVASSDEGEEEAYRSATSPPNCWRSRPGARRARAWRSMSTG